MRVVYKYSVPILADKEIELSIPDGAKLLSVQEQEGVGVCMWALVYPGALLVKRSFRWYGTGCPTSDCLLQYVGTLQVMGGRFVFHLFEVM